MAHFRLFDLNPQQREALTTTEGPVLILAGAGTGKTRVITARAAYLIAEGLAPAASILAVTFTNKAANEMRERVAEMVNKEDARDIAMSTFHSLCVRILRREIAHLGYKPNFTIYDQSEQIGLLRSIITRTAAKDEKLDAQLANSLISKIKGDPREERHLLEKNELLREVYARYQTELKRLNAVDFDDLLLLSVRVFKENPESLSYWQQRFRYVMVDEFQDTNRLQLELAARITATHRNICVVGDDDQSIYAWRGAEVSNILDFERHFPSPKIITLEQNYRSTTAILSTANALIQNNPRRRRKTLWSDLGQGGKVRLLPLPDDTTEAEYIVNEICRRHLTENIDWENFAIIYRMNAQSRLFETNLRQQRIPYRLVGGKSFFDRREVKDVLAYLKILINPDDDISLLRIINTPARGIGATPVEAALQDSIQKKRSLFQTLKSTDIGSFTTTKSRTAIQSFLDLIDDCETKMFAVHADYAQVASKLLEETGYLEDMRRKCKNSEEADDRERNIQELLRSLRDYQAKPHEGLKGFLDALSLDDTWPKNKDKQDGKGIMLITLHAVKGLEFPHVYIIGLEEGILPHSRSKTEGTIDEERRLLYVGITRAQRSLALSHCNSRKKYGQALPCYPSSFVSELPSEHLEIIDYKKTFDAPAEEKSARFHFSRMKELINCQEPL